MYCIFYNYNKFSNKLYLYFGKRKRYFSNALYTYMYVLSELFQKYFASSELLERLKSKLLVQKRVTLVAQNRKIQVCLTVLR